MSSPLARRPVPEARSVPDDVASFALPATDGTQITLHRLRGGEGLPPVVLAPGTFGERRFWTGGRGTGFAYALRDSGFDPWILEVRGHGASEWSADSTIGDWIRHDAPAAVTHILDATPHDGLFWVGHSAGGVLGAGFAASGHPAAESLRGLVLLATPAPVLTVPRRIGALAIHLATRVAGDARVAGRPIRLGPGHEPAGLVAEWMGWNLAGEWTTESGGDYLASLPSIPVLAIGGAGDRFLAPPKSVRDLADRFPHPDRTVTIAGRQTGFSDDYDHGGVVLAAGARAEIWPRIVHWLRTRSGDVPDAAAREGK